MNFGRTNITNVSRARYIVDEESVMRTSGRQVDWANVSSAFIDSATGYKHLPGGTVVVEFNAGQPNAGMIVPFGSGSIPANTTILGLLESDADENGPFHGDAMSGYGVINAANVYETLLPESTGTPKVLPTAARAALNTAGRTTFRFETYADNTAG